jgi:hypothetical protein
MQEILQDILQKLECLLHKNNDEDIIKVHKAIFFQQSFNMISVD